MKCGTQLLPLVVHARRSDYDSPIWDEEYTRWNSLKESVRKKWDVWYITFMKDVVKRTSTMPNMLELLMCELINVSDEGVMVRFGNSKDYRTADKNSVEMSIHRIFTTRVRSTV